MKMKFLIALLSLAFIFPSAGPRFPAASNQEADGGLVQFVNVGNILADDGEVASIFSDAGVSYIIEATGFGFTIPAGSTIDGIKASAKAGGTFALSWGNSAQKIIKGGVLILQGPDGGSNQDALTATLTYYDAGGATDKWGTTWTATDINASNFGVGFKYENPFDPDDMLVDAITITVYYTEASGAAKKAIGTGGGIAPIVRDARWDDHTKLIKPN